MQGSSYIPKELESGVGPRIAKLRNEDPDSAGHPLGIAWLHNEKRA